jgi:DUF917 family protein
MRPTAIVALLMALATASASLSLARLGAPLVSVERMPPGAAAAR